MPSADVRQPYAFLSALQVSSSCCQKSYSHSCHVCIVKNRHGYYTRKHQSKWCNVLKESTFLFLLGHSSRRSNNMLIMNSAESGKKVEHNRVDALVVGSGVTGSTTAFQLAKSNANVLLVEKEDQVGGCIVSRKENGFLWEEGPNTFQPTKDILQMTKELDLENELVFADGKLPRFVYWQGKLHKIPSNPREACGFSLLSPLGKIRAVFGALGIAPMNLQKKEETVKEFVTRHLGTEVCERLIDPFISGVYAGDSNQLSMKAAFNRVQSLEEAGITQSLVEGAIVRLFERKRKMKEDQSESLRKVPRGSLGSFRDGLQMYPQAVKAKLSNQVRTGWKLTKLQKDVSMGTSNDSSSNGDFLAYFSTKDGEKVIRTNAIILTSPAFVTASILQPLIPTVATLLEEIFYPYVVSVSLAYPSSAFHVPLQGFGHLIPRSMKIRTLGTIWSSSLFPYRVPKGYELLLSYIGGAQDTNIGYLSDDDIVKQVDSDIRKILLKETASSPMVLAVHRWKKAIPQYTLGHLSRIERIQEEMTQKLPGVFLGGNYLSGISFGDCVSYGIKLAEQVSNYVRKHDTHTKPLQKPAKIDI